MRDSARRRAARGSGDCLGELVDSVEETLFAARLSLAAAGFLGGPI